jgi:hypothetical protein
MKRLERVCRGRAGRVVRLGRQDVGGDADERGELSRRVGGEPEQGGLRQRQISDRDQGDPARTSASWERTVGWTSSPTAALRNASATVSSRSGACR